MKAGARSPAQALDARSATFAFGAEPTVDARALSAGQMQQTVGASNCETTHFEGFEFEDCDDFWPPF